VNSLKETSDLKKDVKKLIEAYFHKTTERFTPINTPDEISSDNYQIIHCDSRKVEFKDGTKFKVYLLLHHTTNRSDTQNQMILNTTMNWVGKKLRKNTLRM
jgi:hypothetical protein